VFGLYTERHLAARRPTAVAAHRRFYDRAARCSGSDTIHFTSSIQMLR